MEAVLPLCKFGRTVTWHDVSIRSQRTYVKYRLAKGVGKFGKTVMVGKTVGGGEKSGPLSSIRVFGLVQYGTDSGSL
jgi:hypothetical protein